MSFLVIIPSRYGSTRLPAKALADINGKAMIQHVAERALESDASRVIIATDDQRIADSLDGVPVEVCLTNADHQSGSDRLSEVVAALDLADDEIIVNVQGDEPTIPPRLINEVAVALQAEPLAVMATAARAIDDASHRSNPNMVKVVFRHDKRALYFSRSPIPFDRDSQGVETWHHIGIYAYRAGFLRNYAQLKPSALEQAESLEQLRVLDNGFDIAVHCIDYPAGVGVDTQEDLERVRTLLSEDN